MLITAKQGQRILQDLSPDRVGVDRIFEIAADGRLHTARGAAAAVLVATTACSPARGQRFSIQMQFRCLRREQRTRSGISIA